MLLLAESAILAIPPSLSLSLFCTVCIKCVLRALTVFCLDRVERGPCQIPVLTLTPFYRKSHFHDRRSISQSYLESAAAKRKLQNETQSKRLGSLSSYLQHHDIYHDLSSIWCWLNFLIESVSLRHELYIGGFYIETFSVLYIEPLQTSDFSSIIFLRRKTN